MSLYIFLVNSFSKILDILGKSLVGLYEVISVGFFPGFGIMIFASFRDTGQYSNLGIGLNMYRRVCRPSGGISCIICAVLRSGPGALSGLRCLIACLSSLRVKDCRISECWVCVAISLSSSGSRILLCGVNTSARLLANSSTFSESLLPQGPGFSIFTNRGEWCSWLFLDWSVSRWSCRRV